MAAADRGAAFADRLERHYRENRDKLVRVFSRMGLGDAGQIRDAVQDVMCRLLARHARGEPPPANLDAYIHSAVYNALIDRGRQTARHIPLATDRGGAAVLGDRQEPADAPVAVADWRDISIDAETRAAWKELFHAVLDHLPPKYRAVAVLVALGATPAEIGRRFGQNGHVLHRHARHLIGRSLRAQAAAGDPLAGGLARRLCPDGPRPGKPPLRAADRPCPHRLPQACAAEPAA